MVTRRAEASEGVFFSFPTFPFQQKKSSVGSSFLLASSIRRGTFPVMCSGPWRSRLRRQAPFLAVIAPEKASGWAGGLGEGSERQRFCGAKGGRNREPGPGRGVCFAIPAEQPLDSRSWLWSLARTLPLAFQEGAEDLRRCKAFLAGRRAAGGSLPLVSTSPAALFPARPRGGDRRAEGAEPG